MFCDVLEVNKSILRGFEEIRVTLVHKKIDINASVSKIATPVKPKIKNAEYIGHFELVLSIMYCKNYFSKVSMVNKHS